MMDLYDDKNIVPMTLSEEDRPFDSKDYLFELKFDGIRALIYVDKDKILIKSRRGNILNDNFPELEGIKFLVKHKCIFDGEITLLVDGIPSFAKLQERARLKNISKIEKLKEEYPVVFVCFDMIYDNLDITDLSLMKRKKKLNKYGDSLYFVKSIWISDKGKELFNLVKTQNLEGIVAKKKDSKYYINQRTKEWIKIKNLLVDDYYILGYSLLKNGYSISLMLGDENSNYIAKVIVGKNSHDFKIISHVLVTDSKLSKEYPKYIFIKPILRCRVEYLEKTKNGSLRHPIFKGIIN